MITIRKLESLSDGTRRRKIPVVLRNIERILADGGEVDLVYLKELMRIVQEDEFWGVGVQRATSNFIDVMTGPAGPGADDLLRNVNNLKHVVLRGLGKNWADWDAEMVPDKFDALGVPPRPFRVYMDDLRSPFNVGSIIRTSLAFGFERVWASPNCASPSHSRSRRSAMGAVERIPWVQAPLGEIRDEDLGCVFALELGGTPLADFQFPESGTVVLGSEELGVSTQLLERARSDGGVVTIPLPGPKASLNVGVAFGILANRWIGG